MKAIDMALYPDDNSVAACDKRGRSSVGVKNRTDYKIWLRLRAVALNTSVTAAPAVHCCEKLLLIDINIERVIINFGQQYYQL